ncbi:MAG: hypothetical protein OEX12_08535 [Gammaproteobacteria bacterium]|nr:hypothetical protein [Gammaproteobacteria bacterium]
MDNRGHDKRVERRSGSDSLMKVMLWLGLTGWFLMLVALLVLDKAKPQQMENMMSRVDSRSRYFSFGWNDELLNYVFILMVLGFFASLIGLLINNMRHRRRSDSYRVHLIFLLIMSTVGIFSYIF